MLETLGLAVGMPPEVHEDLDVNTQRVRRVTAVVLIIATVLAWWLVLVMDPGMLGWPQPELRPEPPYRLFTLVVGGGLLAFAGITLRRRHALRLWELAALLSVAIVATWLSTYREAGAQPCCETTWIFGYGYPFEYLFGGVAPPRARQSRGVTRSCWSAGRGV
jgi:hypothetical protein